MYAQPNPTHSHCPSTAKDSPLPKPRTASVKGDSDGAESDSSWVKPSRPPSPSPQIEQQEPQDHVERPPVHSSHSPLDQLETPEGRTQSPQKQGKASQDQVRRWLPFSDGPRSCVGQPLAYINVTATLAILLANFHFRLADKVSLAALLHLCTYFYRPQDGCDYRSCVGSGLVDKHAHFIHTFIHT